MFEMSDCTFDLSAKDVILKQIEDVRFYDDIAKHLEKIISDSKGVDETDKAKRWLSWARQNGQLKVTNADIPQSILPRDYEGVLYDVRVFTKYGPDDAIYDNNKDIRERVARGNSFLEITNKSPHTRCVLQAMKKFTGGLGDDDDRESGDDMVWQRYFTKPIEETEFVIATSKANGEAAHLSCIEMDGEFVLCGGSKNVHLMFRNKDDIKKYTEPRYRVATEVCQTVMDFLDTMATDSRHRLLSFLVTSRYTAVFEILSPLHQHVVNLSHLPRPALKFISWTKCELEPSEKLEHLNIVPPHVGIEIAKCLGLDPVDYDVVSMETLDQRIKQIRQGYDLEGEVLFFIDNTGSVIGLLKKKTVWYIMLRAVREKIKAAANRSVTKPDTFSMSKSLNMLEKRMKEIQKWLSLDHETTETWKNLGCHCMKWTLKEVDEGRLSLEEVRDMFPVYWAKFLAATGSTDKIGDMEEDKQTEGACGI